MALTRAVATETVRSQRVAFAASVVLNLFLVGLIGGYLIRPNFIGQHAGGAMDRAISVVESRLDPADAAAFEAAVQRDRSRNAEAERALVASRDALDGTLASEPFDPAKAKLAVTNTREAFDRFVDSFSTTAIDALAQVSPAGRKKLVELRRERLDRFSPSRSP